MNYLKKITIILLLTVMGFIQTFSQDEGYMHGVGLNYVVLFGNDNFLATYGLEYNPRYNFMTNENMSVSAGSHLILDMSLNAESRSGSSFSILVLVPGLVGVNFGALSHEDNDASFGGFIEGGYTYGWTSSSFDISNVNGSFHGPMISAGIRFDGAINEVGFLYVKPINIEGSHMVGIRLALIF